MEGLRSDSLEANKLLQAIRDGGGSGDGGGDGDGNGNADK